MYCLKMKTAGRRMKWSGIWVSGILVTHIWDTFDHVGFRVIFESFGTVVLKCIVTQKRLAVERKGLKFRT